MVKPKMKKAKRPTAKKRSSGVSFKQGLSELSRSAPLNISLPAKAPTPKQYVKLAQKLAKEDIYQDFTAPTRPASVAPSDKPITPALSVRSERTAKRSSQMQEPILSQVELPRQLVSSELPSMESTEYELPQKELSDVESQPELVDTIFNSPAFQDYKDIMIDGRDDYEAKGSFEYGVAGVISTLRQRIDNAVRDNKRTVEITVPITTSNNDSVEDQLIIIQQIFKQVYGESVPFFTISTDDAHKVGDKIITIFTQGLEKTRVDTRDEMEGHYGAIAKQDELDKDDLDDLVDLRNAFAKLVSANKKYYPDEIGLRLPYDPQDIIKDLNKSITAIKKSRFFDDYYEERKYRGVEGLDDVLERLFEVERELYEFTPVKVKVKMTGKNGGEKARAFFKSIDSAIDRAEEQ